MHSSPIGLSAMKGNCDGYHRAVSAEGKSSPTTAVDASPVHRGTVSSGSSGEWDFGFAGEDRPSRRAVGNASMDSAMPSS